MRDSFGFCINGEPTGDETPLYLDDDRERSTCPVCGHIRYEGWCAECNGRHVAALVAERRTAAPVHVLHPVPAVAYCRDCAEPLTADDPYVSAERCTGCAFSYAYANAA